MQKFTRFLLHSQQCLFLCFSDEIVLTPIGRLCSVHTCVFCFLPLLMSIWWIFFCKWMFLSQFSHLDIWTLSSWLGSTLGYCLIVHLPFNFVLCPCPSLLLWFYLLQDFLPCIFKSAYNLLSWTMFCTSAPLQRIFFL